MSTGPTIETPSVDGRRARRERGRIAVVDAYFALAQEHGDYPSVEVVAAAAGVSVSSVFRYFGSIDDLQWLGFERFLERFRPLFSVPNIGAGSFDERVERFAESRVELYGQCGTIMRLAQRDVDSQPRVAEALSQSRQHFAKQIRSHFAPEFDALSAAATTNTVAVIETLTAMAAWFAMVDSHDRSRRQIKAAWISAIGDLLGQ